MISISIINSNIFSMETDSNNISSAENTTLSEPGIYEYMPSEIKEEIILQAIWYLVFDENFQAKRNFKKLAKEINALRLTDRETKNIVNNIITPNLINKLTTEINNESEEPISKIALTRALSTENIFSQNNGFIDWSAANELCKEFINNPNKDISGLKDLIKKGANLDIFEGNQTALMGCVMFGNYESANLLIKAGANLDMQYPFTENTVLIDAACLGHKNIAEILINAGANLNVQNKLSETALISAANNGHGEIVKLLVNAKAKK